MKKIYAGILSTFLLLFLAITFWLDKSQSEPSFETKQLKVETIDFTNKFNLDEYEGSIDRVAFEFAELANPLTGELPDNIKARELAYAGKALSRNLRQNVSGVAPITYGRSSVNANPDPVSAFKSVGPFNVGGRTRGLVMDVADENILLAGGISGGVWRSTDQGASWARTSALQQHPAVTALIQDGRAGKTNEWFYATGERFGNSASELGAVFRGNGIYKSVDGGQSWEIIAVTAVNGGDAIIQDQTFSFVDDLEIDHSNLSGTEIYAGGSSRIIRSEDGFETFEVVLGESNTGLGNYSHVEITSGGKVFATIGNTNFNGGQPEDGVFMSDDGITWTNITPPELQVLADRIEIGIDPSNENIVYFVTGSELMRFDDSDDSWIDLSEHLSANGDQGEGHHDQDGYNLFVTVHPNDPNLLFIGGTNLLRSTDGFTTGDNISQIGGYEADGNPDQFFPYEGHHPDLHGFAFFPSDPKKMLTASDGGIHITTDNLSNISTAAPVAWESLNNGYITGQFYRGDIHNYDIGNPLIMGGMQDNGTHISLTGNDDGDWELIGPGDGTYAGINYNSLFVSLQRGVMFKYVVNDFTNTYEFVDALLTPSDDEDEFLFANPFLYNPVNQDQLFFAARGKIYVTNDIRLNPMAGDWISLNLPSSAGNPFVSAFASSTQPEGVLYIGTRNGKVFKVEDVRNFSSSTPLIEMTTDALPEGNIRSIAVDPENSDRVILAYSNYEVLSLWYSENGGNSWVSISGNLEENADGSGAGPSTRAVEIMPDGQGGSYCFVGTSVGLFMATELDGDNTNWVQQSPDAIGNAIVNDIKTRPIEGLVVAYTHGNGAFSAQYEVDLISNINYTFRNEDQVILRANASFDQSRPLSYQWVRDGEDVPGANTFGIIVTEGGVFQVRLSDDEGNSVLSNEIDLSEALVTSIDDGLLNKVEEIIVDANPSNGIYNLAFPGDFIGGFEMTVVNRNGQRVTTQTVNQYTSGEQVRLDLTRFPDGLYIVNVANLKSRATIKLLKRSN